MRTFVDYAFTWHRHEAPARDPASHDPEHCRVLIVGGGPVGLATALGLANHGVASIVLEADDSVCAGSRAVCISRRSLEIFDQLGALPAFLRTGLPWTGGRSFHGDREVLHFEMPNDAAQRLPPMINIQQYYVEQFLLDACERRADLIEVRWQSRVIDLQVGTDRATAAVETPSGRYRIETDWLLGCDGARSAVRTASGLKLEGTQYEGRYVIADVVQKSSRPVERLAWFDPPSNPGSTILMHRQPDDVWRIDYQLRDDEDPDEAVKPESVIPRIAAHLGMIGDQEDWAPIWISLYKANALTLPRYRAGPCLLLGDAAHLLPIFGVRGVNSGFEDAHNLAWKLALVVQGRASPRLLDSYSDERVHAARENLRYATKSTEFMSPPSFAFDVMRRAVLSLAPRHPWIRSLINPRQTRPSAYPDSPLNQPDADVFAGGPAPGTPLPELRFEATPDNAGRAFLSERLWPGFSLLYFTDAASHERLAELGAELGATGTVIRVLPFAVADGRQAFDAREGTAYLVRPDGHVLARWRKADPGAIAQAITRSIHGEGLHD